MVTMQDRRSFIRAMMATAGAAAAFTPAIARALDIPADRRTGTLQDVDHIVILTQENRSFDHYFGTMRGVRGYGDRFAIPAPPLVGVPNRTVLLQPNEHPGAEPALIAPFRLAHPAIVPRRLAVSKTVGRALRAIEAGRTRPMVPLPM